jgi:hypothetical protein
MFLKNDVFFIFSETPYSGFGNIEWVIFITQILLIFL